MESITKWQHGSRLAKIPTIARFECPVNVARHRASSYGKPSQSKLSRSKAKRRIHRWIDQKRLLQATNSDLPLLSDERYITYKHGVFGSPLSPLQDDVRGMITNAHLSLITGFCTVFVSTMISTIPLIPNKAGKRSFVLYELLFVSASWWMTTTIFRRAHGSNTNF